MITPPPSLTWTRADDGSYTATDADGVEWGIVQVPGRTRARNSIDNAMIWALERLGVAGDQQGPLVTREAWTALHRHPEVLRYASVLAAGWEPRGWRIQNGTPLGDIIMRRGDEHAPLSALMGDPVMIHPQRLVDAELRAAEYSGRMYAAEAALRDAGLPLPKVTVR